MGNRISIKEGKRSRRRQSAKKKRTKKLKKFISMVIIIIALIIIWSVVIEKQEDSNNEEIVRVNFEEEFFQDVEETTATVSEYIVYGIHFNLDGSVEIDDIAKDISSVRLVLVDLDRNETEIETEYEINDDTITFSTGETINEGLNLETLEQTTYYLMLKIKTVDETERYYSLENNTDYGEIEYYTITKNDTNNKIVIDFSAYESISYLNFKVSQVDELPDDVYDVVIDAGHGGLDAGSISTSGNYYESDINLSCAITLKSELEELGLKVKLTRDGSEDENENTVYTMYDEDGRVTVAMESGAKLLISLHMNSNTENLTSGGVEVYAPSNADLTFAKLLADNIVTMADTNYSYLETYKVEDGVYVRTYSESEIAESRQAALNSGYSPYENLTTSTPYLYIIRETGGIATGAFVDGRNTSYGTNEYYDSNVGIESYLIELGYIIVDEDLWNILYNQDAYMEAIASSIESFYLGE